MADRTPQNRAAAERQEAIGGLNEPWGAFFEQCPAGLLIFDLELRIVKCNPGFAALTALEPQALRGRDLRSARGAEWGAALEQALQGRSLTYEGPLPVFGEAAPRWVAMRLSPMRSADGSIVAGIAVLEDTTARRSAEQAQAQKESELTRSSALFRGLVENSLTGIYVLSERRLVYANRRAMEMFGYTEEELCNQSSEEFIVPEERERIRELQRRRLQNGVAQHFETTGLRKDGTTFALELFASRLELAGEVLLVGTAIDVTQQQQTRRALEESEERYRRLVELSPEPILVHVDRQIAFANAAAAQVLGARSPRELVGRRVSDLVDPSQRDRVEKRLDTVLQRREATALEQQRYRRLDGGTVEVEVASIPFSYEGRPAMLSVARDITRRKALEEQLRQSQKLEALGQLAGGIAHDFNNLLAVILSAANHVRGELPTESALLEDVQDVLHAGKRAATLVRQLLAFSRQQPVERQRVDLNASLTAAEALLRRLIQADIRLEVNPAPGPLPVEIDPAQLEQILLNLTVNARDAMPRGGTLTLSASRVFVEHQEAELRGVPAGTYAVLSVRDTGTGIDPAVVPRLFEPFFTTKPVGKGTGLGLATVYGIVKDARGHISVSSVPGQGALFRVLLPLIEEQWAGDDVGSSPVPSPRAPPSRVLLVDDEPLLRSAVGRMLRLQGHHVTEASNGREALELLAKEPVDLVLTDLVMPELGGEALAARAAELGFRGPVLFMSGYDEQAFRENPRSGREILVKPFSDELLAQRIAEAMSPRSTKASGGS